MAIALETTAAAFFWNAEPSATAISSRAAQRRERLLPRVASRLPAGWQTITRDADLDVKASPAGDSITSVQPADDLVGITSQGILTERTLADRIVAQILQLKSLGADWDGNDAAKPLGYSLDDAREFIRALAPESVLPRPALHADGHAILFLRQDDLYAELEFMGKMRIGFFARRGNEEWSDEIDFDGQTLPEGLSRVGFAI